MHIDMDKADAGTGPVISEVRNRLILSDNAANWLISNLGSYNRSQVSEWL